jgi:RNA polymerase sigma-70 factor, ECF subfamily
MSVPADAVNRALGEYRAYLETLTCIHIDPRLRSEFSVSDLIQNTLLEAWRDLERIQALDADGRKRWLRKVLVHNLIDAVDRAQAGKRDARLKQSLDAAAQESSSRLQHWLAGEDTSPSEALVRFEEELRLVEALSKLDARQREAIILQYFHKCKYAEIGELMGCTIGAVAGLHAHGLKKLRILLPDLEIDHA